jgi:adenylate cyclase class IV
VRYHKLKKAGLPFSDRDQRSPKLGLEKRPMARNVEIKARLNDPVQFRRIVEKLGDRQETLQQEDTFFASPRGRLKLRCVANEAAELIYYERPDDTGPRQSCYWISKTPDPDGLLLTLGNALGIVGVVRKTRELFLVGQTRIHLDNVEGLGMFAELEVVLQAGQTAEEGASIATDLMQKLGINKSDLIAGAYIDLLGKLPG